MGDYSSYATGENTIDPYPPIHWATSPKGYDDSAGFLVRGDVTVSLGAEIEGKAVILGDFKINSDSGFLSIVRAGIGSQVVPNNGTDAVLVGGDLAIDNQNITFMYPGYGNWVHKGTRTGHIPQEVRVWNGTLPLEPKTSYLIHNTSLDLSEWDAVFDDIEEKGPHWGSLPPNGIVYGIGSNTITFAAGDDEDIQVFLINGTDLSFFVGRHVKFDPSLIDKSILINVKADENGLVHVKNLANFFDTNNNGGFAFSSALLSQILWNFFDADEVKLGCESSAVGQWRGSVMVPKPNSRFEFCMPGQSGRTIVNGDLVQNRNGSEFHNFDYDPPRRLPCPPLPDARRSLGGDLRRILNW